MKALFFLLLSFAIASCHQQIVASKSTAIKNSNNASTGSGQNFSETHVTNADITPDRYRSQLEQGIDFMASGTEPFWSLQIDLDKSMHFRSVSGLDMLIPAVPGAKAMDADVTRYAAQTENEILIVQIMKSECVNSTSGEKSAYSVIVEAKNNTDIESQRYKGCSQYLYDYRINDTWVLESINNNKIAEVDFTQGLPQLKINIAQRKVFGNTGCNNINGFF